MPNNKNIFHNLSFSNFGIDIKHDEDRYEFKIEDKIKILIAENKKQLDNMLSTTMYDEYKKMGITDLYVMDLEEFKKFILMYLPMYFKDKEVEEQCQE